MLRSVTNSALRNARAEVRVESSIAKVIAYAAAVNNRSGDPVMQLAWPMEDQKASN